jgi:threonine dehydratase
MIGIEDMIQHCDGPDTRSHSRFPLHPLRNFFGPYQEFEIFLKLDNQQRTGAFKERGALNKLLTLTPKNAAQGVIAASAGNHAQGVAYHAGRHGIRARHLHAAAHAAHKSLGHARLRS